MQMACAAAGWRAVGKQLFSLHPVTLQHHQHQGRSGNNIMLLFAIASIALILERSRQYSLRQITLDKNGIVMNDYLDIMRYHPCLCQCVKDIRSMAGS